MLASIPFGLAEPARQFTVGHFNLLRLTVNSSVGHHAVELAFLIADDSDGLLVGAELLDIALDGLLEISKRVADLGYSCHLAGFAENDLDLIFLVFLCQVGIEVDLLETNGVAEVEGRIAVFIHDFDNIRHGQRPALIALRVFQIELAVHILKVFTIDLTLEHTVIDAAVDLI